MSERTETDWDGIERDYEESIKPKKQFMSYELMEKIAVISDAWVFGDKTDTEALSQIKQLLSEERQKGGKWLCWRKWGGECLDIEAAFERVWKAATDLAEAGDPKPWAIEKWRNAKSEILPNNPVRHDGAKPRSCL